MIHVIGSHGQPKSILLSQVVGIEHSQMHGNPSLKIDVDNGGFYYIAFPNDDKRAAFYRNLLSNFNLIESEVLGWQYVAGNK